MEKGYHVCKFPRVFSLQRFKIFARAALANNLARLEKVRVYDVIFTVFLTLATDLINLHAADLITFLRLYPEGRRLFFRSEWCFFVQFCGAIRIGCELSKSFTLFSRLVFNDIFVCGNSQRKNTWSCFVETSAAGQGFVDWSSFRKRVKSFETRFAAYCECEEIVRCADWTGFTEFHCGFRTALLRNSIRQSHIL